MHPALMRQVVLRMQEEDDEAVIALLLD